MNENNYSTKEAAGLLGVTRRQLQHWDETLLLVPRRSKGMIACQPNNRYYTPQDLDRARFIRELLVRGLRTKAIRRVLVQLDLRGSGQRWITIHDRKFRFFTSRQELIDYGTRIAGGMLTLEITPKEQHAGS
jgi:DNA-binding transcriptional MerR regulator